MGMTMRVASRRDEGHTFHDSLTPSRSSCAWMLDMSMVAAGPRGGWRPCLVGGSGSACARLEPGAFATSVRGAASSCTRLRRLWTAQPVRRSAGGRPRFFCKFGGQWIFGTSSRGPATTSEGASTTRRRPLAEGVSFQSLGRLPGRPEACRTAEISGHAKKLPAWSTTSRASCYSHSDAQAQVSAGL